MTERDRFASRHMGLVHAICKRFSGRGIEYEELFAAGCLGLTKAMDGFDSSRGLQFSTYAFPVIMGEVKRLFRDGGAVRVSRSLRELSLKIARLNRGYSHHQILKIFAAYVKHVNYKTGNHTNSNNKNRKSCTLCESVKEVFFIICNFFIYFDCHIQSFLLAAKYFSRKMLSTI